MGAGLDPFEQRVPARTERKPGPSKIKTQPDSAYRPRRFERVPTHAVGVAQERRRSPRAALCLPLRLTQVDGQNEPVPITLVTKNISSSGVYFLAPRWLEPGSAIEMEVGLIDRPLGQGSVRMRTAAHVIRAEESGTPGWRGYAATFDDIAFNRDDTIPLRFLSR